MVVWRRWAWVADSSGHALARRVFAQQITQVLLCPGAASRQHRAMRYPRLRRGVEACGVSGRSLAGRLGARDISFGRMALCLKVKESA